MSSPPPTRATAACKMHVDPVTPTFSLCSVSS